MSKSQKITALIAALLYTVAAFCFFRFLYPYHIHYQESFQLFEFSGAYFGSVASVPGGFADYLGRFMTQFFYFANAGAILTALLLLAVQLLTYAASRSRSLTAFMLGFIPSACLWISYCDENALAGPAIAICIALALSMIVTGIKCSRGKLIAGLIGVPVSYMLCGPLAIVFVYFAFKDQEFWKLATGTALLALLPLVGQYLFAYPASRLYTGIHYYRYHNVFPGWTWIAAACTVIIALVPRFCKCSKPSRFAGPAIFVLTAAALFVGLRAKADFVKEDIMKYDFKVEHRMWNRIISDARKKNPSSPLSVAALNMALTKTDNMSGHMFDFYQNGPQGLLPSFVRESTTAMALSNLYYHLGMVNTAQRTAFEACESIPDYQKSASCYQMLVRTNIINGDYEVAAKYIATLKNTLFYRGWAKQAEKLLYNEDGIANSPEYYDMRARRISSKDFLFSENEMVSMLGQMFMENKENSNALDYLLAWSLLDKDLEMFKQCLSLVSYPVLPELYQEALALEWVASGQNGTFPAYVDRGVAEKFSKFMNDREKGKADSYMAMGYASTYWFYYFYRFK